MSTRIRPTSRKSFICVTLVVLCWTSIILLNIRTTNIFQAFTILYITTGNNLFTIRNTTQITTPQTIETSPFPSDILHDWKDEDQDALAVYILSAIGLNTTTRNGSKADIKLNGWVAEKHKTVAKKCCILSNSEVSLKFHEIPISYRNHGLQLTAHQYECSINRDIDTIRGVALQFDKLQCPQNSDRYIKPFIPKKVTTEESFAICLKIIYEQVDNVKLKDWLEYNRGIGVDKVFMYTYNISQATRDVLIHYIKQGFVEKRPFAYPWNNTRHIGDKEKQVFEDEQVVVSDCLQRLSRYKYLAVVDMDEYLVPRKHDNIKSMMKYLMETNPRAGGFRFHSYIFIKDVKPDVNTSLHLPDYMLHFNRTQALIGRLARPKNIVLPSRITVEKYHTHRFEPMLDYQSIVVNTSVATLNHYRHCYSDLKETCSQLTTDTFMLKFNNIHVQH